ncbi:hypothetical protein PIB30_003826, partial [Stylosanthes scabra]|nr:hypothetical protein [Stylosanthes scabra]
VFCSAINGITLSSRAFFSTGIALRSPPFLNSPSIPSFPLLQPRVLVDPGNLLFLRSLFLDFRMLVSPTLVFAACRGIR